ncbi:MAG: hypothetical protein IJ567_09040 [Lachnospiraceae bacterium]|nr:hypothetical protein [Lachnospiraceae bacterium]
MQYVTDFMQTYGTILLLGALAALNIIGVCIGVAVHRFNRRMDTIQKKIEHYLCVVLAEEEPEMPESEPVSVQEQQMREVIRQKRLQQEEAVFDAVLQEIFP